MHWICAQLGAREHYAIPRVLHRDRKLEVLYTDFWAGPKWQGCGSLLGRPLLTSRYHSELASANVKSFNAKTLFEKSFGSFFPIQNPYEGFLKVGSDFGRSVKSSMERNLEVNWEEAIFFGYDTGFLEPARWVRDRGGKTVVCQMDPSRFEVDLVRHEERTWPGWSKSPLDVPESYFRRREEEWKVAHLVMVNSEWSRQALMRQGVPQNKLLVVPLAYEAPKEPRRTLRSSNLPTFKPFTKQNPLKVLFLGQVILRKGIQYLIEAARSLQNVPVHFDVVGPVGISDEAIKSAPPSMKFHGVISRDRATDFFDKADVFVLPTLSDGFAITQIEAMAHGLPVISTPNCGDVIADGIEGLIIPPRDSRRLGESIVYLLDNPTKLETMGDAARKKADQFSLRNLNDFILETEQRL